MEDLQNIMLIGLLPTFFKPVACGIVVKIYSSTVGQLD